VVDETDPIRLQFSLQITQVRRDDVGVDVNKRVEAEGQIDRMIGDMSRERPSLT
jgi:hypothetical protein